VLAERRRQDADAPAGAGKARPGPLRGQLGCVGTADAAAVVVLSVVAYTEGGLAAVGLGV
jgi:hypothetical protein